MTLERILESAVRSMIAGRHTPHCYRAHVPGQGYVNDGSAAFDRADYLQQLERDARAEVENIGYAATYAEPGYAQPARGVLFANWNRLPRNIDRTLERAGYAVEWSDEWTTCEDCGAAYRTEPDCWTPAGGYCETCTAELCRACHVAAHPSAGQ